MAISEYTPPTLLLDRLGQHTVRKKCLGYAVFKGGVKCVFNPTRHALSHELTSFSCQGLLVWTMYGTLSFCFINYPVVLNLRLGWSLEDMFTIFSATTLLFRGEGCITNTNIL